MIEPMEKKDINCSFCKKHQHSVEVIVVSDDANICNECLDICTVIVEMNHESKVKRMKLN